MPSLPFEQRLLAASPQERRRLIARRPASVGEEAVRALAERARALSTADPGESLRVAEAAGELAEALGSARSRALALRAQALALRAQARWPEALEAFEAGARTAEAAGEMLLAAQIPIAAVETLAQLGRYEEALSLADTLERRLRALGAEEDAAKVAANAGNVHFQREAFLEALAAWERALGDFEARGLEMPAAGMRMNVANVLTQLNRLPEALQRYEEARPALESAGRELLVAGLDGNLGFLQFMAGRYAESLQAYLRARRRFEALGLTKDICQCDREIADVYLALNLVPEAQETYERVIPVFGGLQMAAEMARGEMGLASALAAQERMEAALTALERAEQAFRREDNALGVARARLQRAEWAARRAGTAETSRARREALAAQRAFRRNGVKAGEAQARLCLAEMRVQAGASPIRSLRRLARETEAESLIALQWRVEAALARAYRNAGRLRGAVQRYRRAVQALENVRALLRGDDFQIAFLQDKMRLYEELLALLLDRGTRPALLEGFRLAEQARSRALLEQLAAPLQARPEGAERQKLLRQLEALRQQLHFSYARIQSLEGGASRLPVPDAALPDQVVRLEREVLRVRRHLQLTESASTPDGLNALPLQDLQALLEEDEQIVEYVTVGEEILAFVVDRRRFRTIRGLASRSEVKALVERLHLQWSQPGLEDPSGRHGPQLLATAQKLLGDLHGLLLEPLEAFLQAPRLRIIPHGVLHGVPFHALYDGRRYALDRWEIACAPSSAVWRACRLRGPSSGARAPALIFGLSDPGIAHVQEEVAALKALLPEAEVYEDAAATLAAVPEEGAYRYVHFATHGLFRRDNPLFSALRLADGWLIAHDLSRRRLECDLATLSACRTGLHAVEPGEELLGLARGFLAAGARAVLAGLWAVDDVATAALMQACYARLVTGMGKAAALRQAQQQMRERCPHPYYWAAFALIGAP
ncbi:MAG TPA: CHAT domain-containing protein [Chthonomonadaceae bacterium]|nr:CHAT domain-containing protein [Chthonomonadaceae bacterium]